MTNIRRYFRDGDISFLTNVTHDRQPILVDNFKLLLNAIENIRKVLPFKTIAWVVLPDHFHMMIDPVGNDVSGLMRRIKLSFSANYRKLMQINSGRVWQYRYWDHIIRDENDLRKHLDYIHYNPVKHGLVRSPVEWKYSSYKNFLGDGLYTPDWGTSEKLTFDGDFGE